MGKEYLSPGARVLVDQERRRLAEQRGVPAADVPVSDVVQYMAQELRRLRALEERVLVAGVRAEARL